METTTRHRPIPDGPIDCDELLSRCMGRVELMERMLSSFRENAESDVEALLGAIAGGDSEEIARLAHKLKGTSLTVSARSLASAADLLHSSAGRGQHNALDDLAGDLMHEYRTVADQLSALDLGADS